MRLMTIRQVAATGLISEHFLRLRQKQGLVPGIYSGNRFLVNVEALEEMIRRESKTTLAEKNLEA